MPIVAVYFSLVYPTTETETSFSTALLSPIGKGLPTPASFRITRLFLTSYAATPSTAKTISLLILAKTEPGCATTWIFVAILSFSTKNPLPSVVDFPV